MDGHTSQPVRRAGGDACFRSLKPAGQSDARTQSQSVGQVSEADGDEEIKVGVLDGAGVQMAMETDPRPS